MRIPFVSGSSGWRRVYAKLREPKTLDALTLDEEAIAAALANSPIPVSEYAVDVNDYRSWFERADYGGRHPGYYPGNIAEKSLEHYLAARLLDLRAGFVYLDVASQSGVAAEVYERLHGVTAWRQDLDFTTEHGARVIGGDAAAMEIPGEKFDAIGLHCSFEHFEGPSDSGFVAEVSRILRPGGRCVIAPLYLCHRYACLVDPAYPGVASVAYEPGMLLHMMPGFGNRHCRFYDVDHLVRRVWIHRGELDMKLLKVTNYRDVDPSCYLRYALVMEKKRD